MFGTEYYCHETINFLNICYRYEREFFLNVVNGHGIVSWAAVAIDQPDGQGDELIGFVTTRTIAAKDSEVIVGSSFKCSCEKSKNIN